MRWRNCGLVMMILRMIRMIWLWIWVGVQWEWKGRNRASTWGVWDTGEHGGINGFNDESVGLSIKKGY